MTVDLEDWYHIYPFERWRRIEPRIAEPTLWLLDEFAGRRVKATFFILGYIAEKHPELIRRIHADGHEIGIHGYDHRSLSTKTPSEFEHDLRLALKSVTTATGHRPDIYRAPFFSITRNMSWVWDVLSRNGITRDSSLFAARRLDGGFTGIPEKPFTFKIGSVHINEYPIQPKKIGPLMVPYSGGGYFRLLPLKTVVNWINSASAPAIFYVHPRDFDPGLPDIEGLMPLRRWMVSRGLKSARDKFNQLLDYVPFSSIGSVYGRTELTEHGLD
jgi:polysaccharide deacetylase family protein (PEP-CTERM system associated)